MRIVQRIALMLPVLFIAATSIAQVTTSSIEGNVTSKKQGLEGASIKVVHLPSGTNYATVSKKGGTFNLPGLRAGGPYRVTIEYVGFKPFVEEGFSIPLGAVYDINAEMSEGLTELTNVTVGSTKRRAAVEKIGPTTNIGQLQLNTLPTISRSITDFTRLSPNASGTNFGGRDGRMNNVTVDGANINNNFGLSTDLLPGGGNPISLDAFQEITVNLAPYDVKQSGFTGASISAITKSGTNTFHGSAYTAFRNQSYNGLNVAGNLLPTPATTSNKVYGATLGGPIIKNKLFFFITGESEVGSAPGVTYSPKGGSGNGTTSNVPIDSLAKLANYLQSKYNFNPGAYDNFSAFETKNYKILAKIDWNISTVHKLTAKFNDFKNTGYNAPSGSGGINGANSQSSIVSYIGSYRFGTQAMGYSNSFYSTVDKVRSYSLELNSNFHGKFANQFITTLTKINTTKGHDGAQFPFADILGLTAGNKNNYLGFGNEPFNGNNNIVLNDVFNITDNFTYFAGKHTITAGATYEYQKVGNMFMAGSQGYYVYGSLDDFINNRAPKLFSITYSLLPGQDAVFSANLKIGQLGGYIQDEVNINPKFKLTYGFRIDAPVYPEQPLENPAITALTFATRDGSPVHYTTGRWPKATRYFAPRASFRWDVNGDKSQIIRGGTGIFTGRVPYVLLTNVPSNSGMYQFGSLITATSDLNNFLFNPDQHAYNPFYNKSLNPAQFPTQAGSVAPGTFALTDPNFKFPQVWRSNVAVDQQLGHGWSYTLEGIFTQSLNDPVMRNANQKSPDAIVTLAPGVTRGYYSNTTTARRINTAITNATVLENTNKNMAMSFSASLNKSFSKGFYGNIAYTYTYAADVTANPGSQASSIWSGNATANTQNDLELYNSSFATPHRVVASLSYRAEYFNHLASTFSFFYEGTSQGRYTYIYNGDVNNDGNTADLMYIPKNTSEMNFVALPASGTTPAFSAADQTAAFEKFIQQDPYLSKHRGQVTERNGALYPFYHRVDFNFLQDLFTNIGTHRNTLQFNLSVINFLNLINSNWGIRKSYVVNNPLKVVAVTGGVPTYQLAVYTPQGATVSQLVDRTFVNVNSTSTTWGIQMGFKYLF